MKCANAPCKLAVTFNDYQFVQMYVACLVKLITGHACLSVISHLGLMAAQCRA